MARRAANAHGVRGGMRRQTPLDRFDEAVGEDESVLDRIAGIVDMPREAIAAAIRDEVDREGRVAPGSFNMDPGMRAPDEFTDVTSAGYRATKTAIVISCKSIYVRIAPSNSTS